MKKIKSSQPAIPCTELTKIQLFPVSIINVKNVFGKLSQSFVILFLIRCENLPGTTTNTSKFAY